MNLTTALKIIELTQNSYSQIANSFADSRNSSWEEIDEAIKKYVKPGDQVLDLGCGSGRLLKPLSKIKDVEYLGLDNCSSLIAKAQEDLKKQEKQEKRKIVTNFICQDILDLANITDNSFDCIFMVASFHHLPSMELRAKVMANLHRLLKPGGILIMTNWNLWQIGAKKSAWKNILSNYKLQITDYKLRVTSYELPLGLKDVITLWQNKFPLYYYAFSLRELKKLFLSAGFSILENSYVRRGKKVHWWNGYNILTIGLRTNQRKSTQIRNM